MRTTDQEVELGVGFACPRPPLSNQLGSTAEGSTAFRNSAIWWRPFSTPAVGVGSDVTSKILSPFCKLTRCRGVASFGSRLGHGQSHLEDLL